VETCCWYVIPPSHLHSRLSHSQLTPQTGTLGLCGYAIKVIYEEVGNLKEGLKLGEGGWVTSTERRYRRTMVLADHLHAGRKGFEVLSEEDRKVITGIWRALKPLGRGGVRI
jgi:hypothetical protein